MKQKSSNFNPNILKIGKNITNNAIFGTKRLDILFSLYQPYTFLIGPKSLY